MSNAARAFLAERRRPETDEEFGYLLALWAARSFGVTPDGTAIQYGIELFNGRNPVVRQD